MKISERNFDFRLTSDMSFDGLRLELVEVRDNQRIVVADVSYSDIDESMTISTFRGELPIAAIEALIAEARRKLPIRG